MSAEELAKIPPYVVSEVGSRIGAERLARDVLALPLDDPVLLEQAELTLGDLFVYTYCCGLAAGHNAAQFDEDEQLVWDVADWFARTNQDEPCPVCARPFACDNPTRCIRAPGGSPR